MREQGIVKWRAYQGLHLDSRAAYYRSWYTKNVKRVAENSVRWHAEHPERIAESKRRWRAKNRHKIAAHTVVKRAIRDGLLVRGMCTAKTTQGVCGGIAEAHHEDYSKPLEVVWLCCKHHQTRHSELRRELDGLQDRIRAVPVQMEFCYG
jgi:hypothetical protein